MAVLREQNAKCAEYAANTANAARIFVFVVDSSHRLSRKGRQNTLEIGKVGMTFAFAIAEIAANFAN